MMSVRSEPAGLLLFYELVHKLSSTLDLDTVLAQVLQEVNHFLQIDTTSVSLLDSESQELVIKMTIGKANDPQPGFRLPPYAGIAGWVARHGEPVVVSDAQQDDRFYPAVDQVTGFTTRAMICVPLVVNDRPNGVIQAISQAVGMFSKADLCFMNTLADVAALAIENARLYTLEQQARSQAEALRQISETLGSSLSLDRALALALECARQVVSYDRAMLFVLEECGLGRCADPSCVCKQSRGHGAEVKALEGGGEAGWACVLAMCGSAGALSPPQERVPAAEIPLFQHMCLHKRPIAVADVRTDSRHTNWSDSASVRSWLGVPMFVKGRVIGQVSLDRHQVDPFMSQEVSVAMTFAQQVAGAIANACLYERE